MIYADFNFYKDEYVGTAIPEDQFNSMATKASAFMNYVTFNRIDDINENIKMCCCELAEYEYIQKRSYDDLISSDGKVITSEHVSNYTVNYKNISEGIINTNESLKSDEKQSICKKWLTTPINLMCVRMPNYVY